MEGEEARRPRRGTALLGALLALVVVTCTALGIWQVRRLFWKLDLIARVETRTKAPPSPIPPRQAWPTLDPAEIEYRRVTASGRFRHDRETLVQAVTERGPGFWVLTPLETDDGFALLVNRGFVPPDRRDPATRREGNPEGPIVVTGLLRLSEPGGGFLRANDPADDRWFSRDVAAIAAARGIGEAAPYFVDADAKQNPGGLPIGGLTVVHFRNAHLVYALCWFALAGLGAGGIAFLVRERRAGP